MPKLLSAASKSCLEYRNRISLPGATILLMVSRSSTSIVTARRTTKLFQWSATAGGAIVRRLICRSPLRVTDGSNLPVAVGRSSQPNRRLYKSATVSRIRIFPPFRLATNVDMGLNEDYLASNAAQCVAEASKLQLERVFEAFSG